MIIASCCYIISVGQSQASILILFGRILNILENGIVYHLKEYHKCNGTFSLHGRLYSDRLLKKAKDINK